MGSLIRFMNKTHKILKKKYKKATDFVITIEFPFDEFLPLWKVIKFACLQE